MNSYFILIFGISSLVSFLIGLLPVKYGRNLAWTVIRGGRVQDSHQAGGHRVGGLGILISIWFGYKALEKFGLIVDESSVLFSKLLFFLTLVFLVGLFDDIRGNVTPRIRVGLVLLVALSAGFFVGWIDKVNIDMLDDFVSDNKLFAATLTLFGVLGLTNAFNLIDGLNGLCSGTSFIILSVLMYLSIKIGYPDLGLFLGVFLGAILGFFFLNFPYGKLFLGDGGSYLLGFAIAQICVLMNGAGGDISSWVFILICIYPIWETIFSFFRRLMSGKSWDQADREHLHTLVYDYLSETKARTGRTNRSLLNGFASLLCLSFPMASGLVALIFYDNSSVLQISCVLAVGLYLMFYTLLSSKLRRVRSRP